MNNIFIKDIQNGKLLIGDENTILDNFSTDTRTIQNNDVFVGIKGISFDGSTLYKDALEKGAKGCILNKDTNIDSEVLDSYKDRFIILVDDTLKCLQELATYKRSLYNIPVIGITGSVGKTSTKDAITNVLKEKYNVLSTIGNYNNHLGVPLTILRLKDENCAVIEMGMNNLGEISVLSKIAKPTVSVITNVGTAHIGNLGSRENILKAKLEILEGMDDKGILVINNDNDLLHKYYLDKKFNNIITFGINNDSNYMAKDIIKNNEYSTFKTIINGSSYDIKINVPGDAFIMNSLCAIAVSNIFNIDIDKIKKGLEKLSLTKKRMEIEKINNITVINDAYNANIDSMNNAINYLGSLNTRKIAVIGSMLELGEYTEKLHREVGKNLLKNNIDIVITVGKETLFIKDELNKNNFNDVYTFTNNNDALNKIKEVIKDNDSIIFKASNSLKFYDMCNELKEYLKNN